MPPGRRGRKSKLTPERAEQIVELIADGNYATVACRAAGIAQTTLYEWLKLGRKTEAKYKHYWSFREQYELAEATAEADCVATITRIATEGKKARGDWRAAMTFLERRYPDRWRARTGVDVSGPDGAPLVDPEALLKKMRRLAGETEKK